MPQTYSLKLAHGPFGDETRSTSQLDSEADAMRMGRLLLEHAAKTNPSPNGLSVLIGIEGGDDPQWLGAWHWDGAPKWVV